MTGLTRSSLSLKFVLGGLVLATAGCASLGTKFDTQAYSPAGSNKIEKIIVVESTPKLGLCNDESLFGASDDESIMSFFNASFRADLMACGVTAEFASSPTYDARVQDEMRAHGSNAVLVMRVGNTTQAVLTSHQYMRSAVMKAAFDLQLMDTSGKKIWGGQSSFDRTPPHFVFHNTATCEGTGTQFAAAVIQAMNKDGVIACSPNQVSQ